MQAREVGGERLAQLGEAVVAGVEQLPRLDRGDAGAADKLGRGLVGLADPEGDDVLAADAGVELNSPNNPTGWTISREDQRAVLEHCRRHGIWIFADDAYERLYYEGNNVAPSFLDLAEPGERVISTNTFSKSWLMTGWRLGWAVLPAALEADMGKLVEYNTSCAPVFVQRAGLAAVTQGEPVIAHTLERFRKARDFLVKELRTIPGVEVASPLLAHGHGRSARRSRATPSASLASSAAKHQRT